MDESSRHHCSKPLASDSSDSASANANRIDSMFEDELEPCREALAFCDCTGEVTSKIFGFNCGSSSSPSTVVVSAVDSPGIVGDNIVESPGTVGVKTSLSAAALKPDVILKSAILSLGMPKDVGKLLHSRF